MACFNCILILGGGMDITELIDSPDTENALLQCRTVRIGSYKVVPFDKVLLSEYGLKIQVPSMKGGIINCSIYMMQGGLMAISSCNNLNFCSRYNNNKNIKA